MKPQESTPHISVVVLTHNRKKALEGCLASLFNQTYHADKFEIIVADDGSSDGTNALVEDLRKKHLNLKYVYQKNQGVAAARNAGIKNAAGEIIAFVADDYSLPPHYLSTVEQFFIDYPNAMIVRFKIIGSDDSFVGRAAQLHYQANFVKRADGYKFPETKHWLGELKKYLSKAEMKEEAIKPVNVEAAGAAAFKKEVFEHVGLFDPSLKRTEDSDIGIRLIKNGIEIYYNPHLSVIHKHSPLLRDQLKKFFWMGYHRYYYLKKYNPKAPLPFLLRLRHKMVGIFLAPFWIARQAENEKDFIPYLPIIYLLHTTSHIGFYSAAFGNVVFRRPGKPR